MAGEGTVIPGELDETSQSPHLMEEKAKAKGWKPRDESDLPDEQWVDAREFLGRQPLFDQIHTLKRELSRQSQTFNSEISKISEHFAKMQQVEFDKAMKQLKAEKRLAIEDQNLMAVESINEEIQEKEKEFKALQQQAPKAPAVNQIAAEEFNEWRASNKWFDEPELQREAIQLGTGFASLNRNATQTEILGYIGEKIKKLYPEKFETKKRETVTDSKVEAGGITEKSSFTNKKSRGLSKSDLSQQELSVMSALVRQGVLKAKAEKNKITQEQQYLNDLAEAKGL